MVTRTLTVALRYAAAAQIDPQDPLLEVSLEELPVLDEGLRPGWPHIPGWHNLRPSDITRGASMLLCVFASHPSGYVREEALRRLRPDEDERIVPFLLLRLTDWVEPVRDLAEGMVAARLEPRYGGIFAQCLSLVERLSANSRWRFAGRIEDLLRRPECAGSLRGALASRSRVVKRRAYALAVANPGFEPRALLDQALSDGDAMVRRWAFEVARDVFPEDRAPLLARAAKDPYGPIRRTAMEAGNAADFLLDRAASIRREAQRASTNAAEFYRSGLNSEDSLLEIRVLGLGETGSASDGETVAALLSHRRARVRRAAIRAAGMLRTPIESRTLLAAVASDLPSVAREAAATLIAERAVETEPIWRAACANADSRVANAVLPMFRRSGKWPQMARFLEAAISADERIAIRASVQIRWWIESFNARFTQPTEAEKAEVRERFAAARRCLDTDMVRELKLILDSLDRGRKQA